MRLRLYGLPPAPSWNPPTSAGSSSTVPSRRSHSLPMNSSPYGGSHTTASIDPSGISAITATQSPSRTSIVVTSPALQDQRRDHRSDEDQPERRQQPTGYRVLVHGRSQCQHLLAEPFGGVRAVPLLDVDPDRATPKFLGAPDRRAVAHEWIDDDGARRRVRDEFPHEF